MRVHNGARKNLMRVHHGNAKSAHVCTMETQNRMCVHDGNCKKHMYVDHGDEKSLCMLTMDDANNRMCVHQGGTKSLCMCTNDDAKHSMLETYYSPTFNTWTIPLLCTPLVVS